MYRSELGHNGHKDIINHYYSSSPNTYLTLGSGNEAGQCGTASAPPTKDPLIKMMTLDIFTPYFSYLPEFIHHSSTI